MSPRYKPTINGFREQDNAEQHRSGERYRLADVPRPPIRSRLSDDFNGPAGQLIALALAARYALGLKPSSNNEPPAWVRCAITWLYARLSLNSAGIAKVKQIQVFTDGTCGA